MSARAKALVDGIAAIMTVDRSRGDFGNGQAEYHNGAADVARLIAAGLPEENRAAFLRACNVEASGTYVI